MQSAFKPLEELTTSHEVRHRMDDIARDRPDLIALGDGRSMAVPTDAERGKDLKLGLFFDASRRLVELVREESVCGVTYDASGMMKHPV